MVAVQIDRASGDRAKDQAHESKAATNAQERDHRVREAESCCDSTSDRGGHLPRRSDHVSDIVGRERWRGAHRRSHHRLAHRELALAHTARVGRLRGVEIVDERERENDHVGVGRERSGSSPD